MKGIVWILIIALSVAMMVISGAVMKVANDAKVEPFIMQPKDSSKQRVPSPLSLSDMEKRGGDTNMVVDRLIEKFLHEYFDAVPPRKSELLLKKLISPELHERWLQSEKPEIDKIIFSGGLRRAYRTNDPIEMHDQYFRVNYRLVTFNNSDDMNAVPTEAFGTMFIHFSYKFGIRSELFPNSIDAGKYFKDGGSPAVIFNFGIDGIEFSGKK